MARPTSTASRLGCLGAAVILCSSVLMLGAILAKRHAIERRLRHISDRIQGQKTVSDRLHALGPGARDRLEPAFERAGVPYPPERLVFVGLKRERELEVYASGGDAALTHIITWPILGASGTTGPKLEQGDKQVPEGFYDVDFLNPNSTNHLSMRVDYPNHEDRLQAALGGRTNLGGEIYIHGKRTSAGCLAMGDTVATYLFVLAADTGHERIEVILSPVDFRQYKRWPKAARAQPDWVKRRYSKIEEALAELPPRKKRRARRRK